MAITKEEILKLVSLVKQAQAVDADDQTQIQALSAQVNTFKADHDLVNDPDVNAALDEVLNTAVVSTSADAGTGGDTSTPPTSGDTGAPVPAPSPAPTP